MTVYCVTWTLIVVGHLGDVRVPNILCMVFATKEKAQEYVDKKSWPGCVYKVTEMQVQS